MKSTIKKTLFLSLSLSLLTLTACEKDFDTINDNPNDPVSLPAELLLPHAIRITANSVVGGSLGLDVGPLWSQHLARIQYTEIDQFNFTTDVQDTPWQNLYIEANASYQKIIDLGKTSGNENYQAIGLIMRSYVFSQLTDVYGDIPYTEALLGTKGTIYPKYDAQKDVYTGLVAELKTASELINTKTVNADADILFKGDMGKWKKFANSLSLRLLNRMLGKADAPTAKAEMERILGDPAKYPVLASNADNVQLVYLAAAPNNNRVNENRKTRDDHRVSKTLVDKLQALKDPRLAVFAKKAESGGDYVGVPNGLGNVDAGNLGLAKTSKIGDYFVAATAPGVLLSFAELNFIKAEAALKGVTAAGDAAKAYEDGIRASMTQFGVTMPADYLTTNKLSADATAARTQVLEQKWLALFGQEVEAWTEFRRTGVPALKVPAQNYNAGMIPTRLPYPSSEENLNGPNFKAALTAMGGANTMQTKLWWAK